MSAAMTITWRGGQKDSSGRQSRWQRGTGAMDRANQEIRQALERTRHLHLAQTGRRHCLTAIDDCLTTLEEMHAGGAFIARRDGCRKVVAELVATIRVDPPEDVQSARTSYHLHSALLNWESGVLDALVPRRRERFPDLNQETDDWPRPRRRRRRRRVAEETALSAA